MRNLDEYTIQCMKELDTIGIEYGNIIESKQSIWLQYQKMFFCQ